ncbi:MAG: arginyltransferase [Desulfobacteraceae bacterium]|nr:MAG: arginyltransferase [Desulfobacteraceae bacterium]
MEETTLDFKHIATVAEKYLYEFSLSCPYGFQRTATYQEARLDRVPDELMGHFLPSGYRRHGDSLYRMNCAGCDACTPIRLQPVALRYTRNQRRVAAKNRDISVQIREPELRAETLDVFRKFLRTRFPESKYPPDESYRHFFANRITNTKEIHFRRGKKLIGISVVDLGKGWVNAVYFYFDPDEGRRSPGTFNVIHLNEFCKHEAIPYLYLGYWTPDIKAMRYKNRFRPHQLLKNGEWVTLTS